MKKHCAFHVDYLESCRFCRDLNPPEDGADVPDTEKTDNEDVQQALATLIAEGAVAEEPTPEPSMDTPADIPDAPAAADLGDGFGGGISDGGGASGDF